MRAEELVRHSRPRGRVFLVSTKNRDLWEGLTPEVRDSRTPRHSVHAQSQVWQSDWLRIILVPRGRASFGQHQESRTLAGSNFLSMRREFVLYSQPNKFVRLNSEHAQSDGKFVNCGLPMLDRPRFLDADQEKRAGLRDENAGSRFSA